MQKKIIEIDRETATIRRKSSLIYLYYEFARRSILWAEELNIRWHPAADYSKAINSNIRASEEDTEKIKNIKSISHLDEHFFKMLLHWHAIKFDPTIKLRLLPDLYEPLLKFYERGGSLTSLNGYFNICIGQRVIYRIPKLKSAYEDIVPLIDLSENILNRLDEHRLFPY